MKSITLNIGGEERVFHFGLGFIGNLLEVENISMHEIDAKLKGNPFLWVPKMMYHSCAFGFERIGEKPNFNSLHVSEWIDEVGMDSEQVKDFLNYFMQSLIKNVPEDKSPKKKVTKK